MFKIFTSKNNLEKMIENHELGIEKLKLETELNIEKKEIERQMKMKDLDFEKEQTDIKRDIFILRNTIKKDDNTIKRGKVLMFWTLLITFISTMLTIAGNFNTFSANILTLSSYILAIIALQFTVFIITSNETRIKQEFVRHYSKINILKYMLLGISIYSNYKYFCLLVDSFISRVFILILCIAIDLIAVFLVSLAYDQKTLTFSYSVEKKVKTKESNRYKMSKVLEYFIFKKVNEKYFEIKSKENAMICNNSNIINLDKYVKIDGKSNHQKQIAENTKEKSKIENIDINLVTKYIDYMIGNVNDSDKVEGYKTIALKTGIDRNIANDIKRELDNLNITKVVNKKTFLLIKSKDEIYNKLQLKVSV